MQLRHQQKHSYPYEIPRHADFLEQAEVEQPLEKCVEYIRDNPDEFLDEGILGR